jgi:hypothetical protein
MARPPLNPGTVRATPEALTLIERLVAEHGPLAFIQSGGCCDGSSPLCMRRGELRLRDDDLLLGSIAGVSYYIDAEMYERWNRPEIVVGVSPEAGDSFSLEGTVGMHFVLLPPD